ncbi:MAG TPA: undecaprenyl-phosphate glucose phosphotransferase [Bacteroidota bacterium]
MAQTRRTEFFIPLLTLISDALAIEFSFLAAYWLRFDSPLTGLFEVTRGFPPIDAYLYGSLAVIPVWVLIFTSRNLYSIRRNVYITDEFFTIVKLVTVGMLIVMSAAFFYRAFSYSRLVFGMIWLLSIFTVTSGRFLLLELEKYLYRKGHDLRETVVVGSTPTANTLYWTVQEHPNLGYKVLGYFSDRPSAAGTRLADAIHLGRLDEVGRYLRRHPLDLALIALNSEDHPRLYEMIRLCEGLNVEFMMVPDVLEMMTSRVRLKEIEGIPFLRIKDIPMTPWNRITKRAFDILVSVTVLVMCSPLLLVSAPFIKLTSRGPILYKQERVGLDGRTFQVMKLRTMRVDAEAESGPVWARRNDPRVTVVGKILRRLSIDELPQLVNVLKGEMSIVGPRPERPQFVEKFRDQVPKYLERHRVKTGLTGWAQVNGLRGNTSIDERTKYDVYYVENWSLVFDVKIILKTMKEVLLSKQAY